MDRCVDPLRPAVSPLLLLNNTNILKLCTNVVVVGNFSRITYSYAMFRVLRSVPS